MCAVSMIGDHYKDKWYPNTQPVFPYNPVQPLTWPSTVPDGDIAALRKEVREMKELLKRALKYDEETKQPHCEKEDKIKILKDVAKLAGIELPELDPK